MRPTVPVFLSLILLAGLLPASAEANAIKCIKVEFAGHYDKSPTRSAASTPRGTCSGTHLLEDRGAS